MSKTNVQSVHCPFDVILNLSINKGFYILMFLTGPGHAHLYSLMNMKMHCWTHTHIEN